MTRSSSETAQAARTARRGRALLVGTLLALLAGASGGLAWYHWPQRHTVYTDAETIRTPRSVAAVREVLWQPPVPLGEVINTGAEDYEPRLSWDGLTLYFVRGRAGQNADIFVARRTPAGWSAAEPLAVVNSTADDLGPEPSPDGQALYFYSNRAGGCGGYDLWVARRTDEGWTEPSNLGPGVNSEFNDYGPAAAPDGLLYFASNRPPPEDRREPRPDAWPATVREDLYQRTYDLYAVQLAPPGPRDLRALAALNTPANEGAPCLSPAGDFLYFSSDRAGGRGGFDLYRARCVRGAWWPAENLDAPVNTAANELDPGLAALGYGLYFSSDRPAERLNAERPNDYNLYYSASREVFAETETTQRPPLNWAGLWRALGPNLLWALLALLLLLLLLTFLRDAQRRRLSLLARCLLASAMVHLLLMFLFNAWQVTTAAVDYARRGGEIRVALGAAGPRAALASQLQGGLTELVRLPAATQHDLVRATLAAVAEVPVPRHESAIDPATVHGPTIVTRVEISDVTPGPAAVAPLAPKAQAPLATPALTVPAPIADVSEPAPAVRAAMPEVARSSKLDPSPEWPPLPAQRLEVAPPAIAVQGAEPGHSPHVDARDAVLAPAPAVHLAPTAALAVAVPRAPAAPPTEEVAAAKPAAPTAGDGQAPRAPVFAAAATGTSLPQAATPAPLTVPLAAAPARVEVSPADAPTPALELPAPSPWGASRIEVGPLPEVPDSAPPRGTEVAVPLPGPQGVEALRPALPLPAIRAETPRAASLNDSSRAAELPAQALQPLAPAPVPTPIGSEDAVGGPMALAPRELTLALRGAPDSLPEPDAQAPGVVSGIVRAADSGAPLADAIVRLDRGGEDLIAATDAAGRYTLAVADVPDFFALSASRQGYLPESANVSGRALQDGPVRLDFELAPRTRDLVIVEELPDVHHVGNDRFDGRINSQFQKPSEGLTYVAEFDLTVAQTQVAQLRLTLMAKGVQCGHEIRLNGAEVASLARSPADGSFGDFAAELDPKHLREGLNRLEIHSARCSGDIDDFEFVNVQLHLRAAAAEN